MIRRGFWRTVTAIACGVYLALWLMGGDRDPDAAERIRPKASTPGVTRPLTRTQVCDTKWSLDRRHVTEGMKKRVAAAYGIRWADHAAYEFDHLIPRELGGADVEANLWPQPYTGPFNARQKDRLENRLHVLVCAGRITLDFAQEAIRTDWIAAYRLYIEARQ